jgi:hypothetical protein
MIYINTRIQSRKIVIKLALFMSYVKNKYVLLSLIP